MTNQKKRDELNSLFQTQDALMMHGPEKEGLLWTVNHAKLRQSHESLLPMTDLKTTGNDPNESPVIENHTKIHRNINILLKAK